MKPPRVLIIDDEPLMRLSMLDALQAVGYEVRLLPEKKESSCSSKPRLTFLSPISVCQVPMALSSYKSVSSGRRERRSSSSPRTARSNPPSKR